MKPSAAVPADDWKALVRTQGGDPVSPAFSILDQRATLLDRSLFLGSAVRNKELSERFGMTGPALVDLAITHEMGHGICQEKNERRADDYGKELRDGKTPDCARALVGKQSSDTKSVATAPPDTLRLSLQTVEPVTSDEHACEMSQGQVLNRLGPEALMLRELADKVQSGSQRQ